MAIRTNDGRVKVVLAPGLDYDTARNPSLFPFRQAASLVVDRLVSSAAAISLSFTDDELIELESWLAAHFYKMSDQQTSSKSTAGASGSYRAAGGLNLDGSTYGQTAKMLDHTGLLAQMGQVKATASAMWLGKPPSEQTPYYERD